MTSMHDVPRETLRQIVTTYGREILADPRRCRALLMDLCPEFRGEINLLEMALRERVVEEFAETADRLPRAFLIARLAQRLQDAYFLPEEAARWAVEACVSALDGAEQAEAARVFTSRVPATVLARAWLAPEGDWRELGRTPGTVTVPDDEAVRISARVDDCAAAKLMQDIARFGSIQDLDLSYSSLTDAGAAALREISGLLSLSLARAPVGETGLAALAAHPQLLALDLWGCEVVTDRALGVLDSLVHLERLELGMCPRITDAGVAYLAPLVQLTTLGLAGAQVTDRGLATLAALASLARLDLGGTPITGSGLRTVGRLPDLVALDLHGCVRLRPEALGALRGAAQLRELNLGACGLLTDGALVHVRPLRGLTVLNLERLGITDAGVLYLTELVALSRLDLGWTRVGDAGLARLSTLHGLRSLVLSGTAVSDAGLMRLAALPDLVDLNLSNTAVTDAGLRALVAVPTLETLDLEGTGVRDAGLVHLGELPALRRLYLGGTGVTDAGLDLLRRVTTVETVDLTLCEGVTDAGIRLLEEAGIAVSV